MAMLKDSGNIAALRSLHDELWERLQRCEEQEAEALLLRCLSEVSGENNSEIGSVIGNEAGSESCGEADGETSAETSDETGSKAEGGTCAETSSEAPIQQLNRPSGPIRELLTIKGVVFSVMAGVSITALFVVFFVYIALWIE